MQQIKQRGDYGQTTRTEYPYNQEGMQPYNLTPEQSRAYQQALQNNQDAYKKIYGHTFGSNPSIKSTTRLSANLRPPTLNGLNINCVSISTTHYKSRVNLWLYLFRALMVGLGVSRKKGKYETNRKWRIVVCREITKMYVWEKNVFGDSG